MNTQNQQHPADREALWHNQDTAERGVAATRAALEAAKQQLCPHGVRWRHCHRHDGHVIAGEVVSSEETR